MTPGARVEEGPTMNFLRASVVFAAMIAAATASSLGSSAGSRRS
jgi:hypothetical protein